MGLDTSRRGFLLGATATAASLVVGLNAKGALALPHKTITEDFTPFVKIASDSRIIAIVKHFEMGEGTTTGLTSLIAEELNANLDDVEFEFSPSDARYNNTLFQAQLTGGSTAMADSYMQYRKAGAAARTVLLAAAAQTWGVPVEELTLDNGTISGAGQMGYIGEFVEAAAKMELPQEPVLKDPSEFRVIGNPDTMRKDTPPKINGSAKFGMDVMLPNQIVAVMIRPPQFGATLTSFDASAAQSLKGFVDAKARPSGKGVVVYASSTWSAFKAREAITAEWDLSQAESRSQEDFLSELTQKLDEPPAYAVREAMTSAAMEDTLAGAAHVVEAEFYFPNLAHAPMEPLNCTIEPLENGVVIVHDGCQFRSMTHPVVAGVLGLDPAQVQINTVFAGGSFGRRANNDSDYQAEAAEAFSLTDRTRPVKLVFSREDDIHGGYYRPVFMHRVRVGLDESGTILGWDHRLAGQSLIKGTVFESAMVHDGVDATSVEGIDDTPYALPVMNLGLTDLAPASTLLWWRSVGHSHTAYVMESMMDMAAEAAGEDPVAFRLKHLSDADPNQSRMAGVLKAVAEAANWGSPVPEGHGRGIAVHKSFNTYVAEVAEVSSQDGTIRIEAITCAVDCGIAVNPDVIKAQMEGGIGYGLSAYMRNEITFDKGRVVQSNFPDYEPLRISDVGRIDVHIVPSTEPPTGVGEPGLPPSGPAVANAIAAATGARVTRLPMAGNGVDFA